MSSSDSGNVKGVQGSASRGLAWVGLASSFVGALDIVAYALIVALWLPKEEFGAAGLAFTLFKVLDLATDLGIAAAVVQRDDHTPERLSTVFWLNVGVSLVLFAALGLFIGPGLAALHDAPILADLFLVYGGKLIWQNVYFIPHALMKRELRFKELSVIRMLANVAEFGGKIGFAAGGFGAWCFVAGPICRVLVTAVGVQLRNPWRPRMVLRIREAFGWAVFGVQTSGHKILYHLYSNVDYQVVGYYFGKSELALYLLAFKIVLEPAFVLSRVVVNVAFPVFSRLKNHRVELYEQLVAFLRVNMVVMLAFLGVVFVATEEILVIFSQGDDYSAAAPAVRMLCAVAILRALSFVFPPFLDGCGRPGLSLRYTVIAAVLLPALFALFAIFLGDEYGHISVVLAWNVGYPLAFALLVWMTLAVLETTAWQLLSRMTGIAVSGVVAAALAGLLKWRLMEAPYVVRLGAVVVVVLTVFGALLARFEGISPRRVARSLRKG